MWSAGIDDHFSMSKSLKQQHKPKFDGHESSHCNILSAAECPPRADTVNSEAEIRTEVDSREERRRLCIHGEEESAGSALHPHGCTPCAFFCFKVKGCAKGADCIRCHKSHTSQ